MDSTGSQQERRAREERYAYMFRYGQRRFLYIRNFGSGTESVAQLVEDIDTREVLIRKVRARRPRRRRKHAAADENWRPKKPREIRILEAIRRTFRAPEPGLPAYIAECYDHEYIRCSSSSSSSEDVGAQEEEEEEEEEEGAHTKYSCVSYWRLYNGRSVRTRWLTGDVRPPVAAVARMTHQVLGTLHYLYTAGERPVYHEDLHFGNVWAHWTADAPLPDFYLGDFADAGFAGSRDGPCPARDEASLQRGRPIGDLHRFWSNLDSLVSMITTSKEGEEGGIAHRELRKLSSAIENTITRWWAGSTTAKKTLGPPDLRDLIAHARHLEKICGAGEVADETQTEAYIRYVTEERARALAVGGERGLVVQGVTKAEALLRRGKQTRRVTPPPPLPLAIHGPWQLVRQDWVPAEAEGVTHHRPSRGRGRRRSQGYNDDDDDEDLSQSRQGEDASPPEWLETDTDTDTSCAIGTEVLPPPPPPRPEPSPAQFSWAPGDDEGDNFQVRKPTTPTTNSTQSRKLPSSSNWNNNSDHNNNNNKNNNQPIRRANAQRRRPPTAAQPKPLPAPSLTRRRRRRCQREHPGGGPPGPPEQWHALLHGECCKCAEETWRGDVAALLRRERRRRLGARTGLEVSLQDLREPWATRQW